MKSLLIFPVATFLLLCSAISAHPTALTADSSDGAAATKSDDSAAAPRSAEDPAPPSEMIAIPGPTRSFLRMAAISQKVSPEEITPLLARNVYLLGYEGPQSQAHQTEFLTLLNRYVQQARELVTLAGSENVIHVTNCEDAKPLLQVLGYRVRPD